MVNTRAAKVALLVAGVLLLALFAGQVLRRVTWMLSWAMLVGLVMLVGYAVYELKSGWSEAADTQEDSYPTQSRTEQTATEDTDTLEDLQQSYVEAELSEEEFEAELETLMDDNRARERELEK